jgi:hypothetical protein
LQRTTADYSAHAHILQQDGPALIEVLELILAVAVQVRADRELRLGRKAVQVAAALLLEVVQVVVGHVLRLVTQ